MCPVSIKAIKLSVETVTNIYGESAEIHLPRVNYKLCIGCGICEAKCPVNGEAAIRIYTVNGDLEGQGNGLQRRGNNK